MEEPNRASSDWLPEVEACPNRAVPCGNPLDADEAMRAGMIIAASNDNPIALEQATQAIKHARKIASKCSVAKGECPLEKHFGCSRGEALNILSQSMQ